MTLKRLRENGFQAPGLIRALLRGTGTNPSDDGPGGGADRQEEGLEKIRRSDSLADEYIEKYPTICQTYDICSDVELGIANGTATPDQIKSASAPTGDPFLDTYTTKYREDLRITCINYGIDPITGRPDTQVVRLLLAGIEAGLSDQEALQFAYLGAHPKIPEQIMRDKQFQVQLARARRVAHASQVKEGVRRRTDP